MMPHASPNWHLLPNKAKGSQNDDAQASCKFPFWIVMGGRFIPISLSIQLTLGYNNFMLPLYKPFEPHKLLQSLITFV